MLQMLIRLNAPVDRVYKALTDNAELEAWFTEHANISLSEKRYDFWGRFTPEAPDREAGKHTLLAHEAGKYLKYGWHLEGKDTTVEIWLLARDARTVLLVKHEGAMPEDFWFLSLENLRRYLDGKPVDARVDFSQPMLGDIRHEIEIDAPPEKVFPALIRPDQLERWIATNAHVEPRVGGDYDFGWGMPPHKIVELVENERLSLSGLMGENENILTWTLEGSGGKTRLTLVHSGFAPDQPNEGLWLGWRNFQNWLRSMVEYGEGWQPPITQLSEGHDIGYAKSIFDAQGEFELNRPV